MKETEYVDEQFKSKFEYPQPVAVCETKNIDIRCSETKTYTLMVENAGYGTLHGSIFSDSSRITFEPNEWRSNKQAIRYTINIDGLKENETLHCYITIMTNGGERNIPVKVTVQAISLSPEDNIVSLVDFFAYYKTNRDMAAQLFNSQKFYNWLKSTKPEALDIYSKLLTDTNKERAMDNFFVVNKLKETTNLTLVNDNIKVEVSPSYEEHYNGTVILKRSDSGFIECSVDTKFDTSWLYLPKKKVLSSDFTSDNLAHIPFVITTQRLSGTRNFNAIELFTDNKVLSANISVKVKPLLKVSLSQESYALEDRGYITIESSIGKDVFIEIFSADNFIKFDARRYPLGSRADIPFTIKVTGFAAGIAGFFQKPLMHSSITVRTISDTVQVKETINILLGNF